MKISLLTAFSLILVSSSSAYAEVMDKAPTLESMFLWGLVGPLLVIFSIRFKPCLLLLALPLPVLYFYGLILDINDPYAGPAILNEAGSVYLYSVYLLSVLLVFSPFIGMIWRKYNNSLKSD